MRISNTEYLSNPRKEQGLIDMMAQELNLPALLKETGFQCLAFVQLTSVHQSLPRAKPSVVIDICSSFQEGYKLDHPLWSAKPGKFPEKAPSIYFPRRVRL